MIKFISFDCSDKDFFSQAEFQNWETMHATITVQI